MSVVLLGFRADRLLNDPNTQLLVQVWTFSKHFLLEIVRESVLWHLPRITVIYRLATKSAWNNSTELRTSMHTPLRIRDSSLRLLQRRNLLRTLPHLRRPLPSGIKKYAGRPLVKPLLGYTSGLLNRSRQDLIEIWAPILRSYFWADPGTTPSEMGHDRPGGEPREGADGASRSKRSRYA